MAVQPLLALGIHIRAEQSNPVHLVHLPPAVEQESIIVPAGHIEMPTKRILLSASPIATLNTAQEEETPLARIFIRIQSYGRTAAVAHGVDSVLPDILESMKNIIEANTLIYNARIQNGPVDGADIFEATIWRYVARTYSVFYDLRRR